MNSSPSHPRKTTDIRRLRGAPSPSTGARLLDNGTIGIAAALRPEAKKPPMPKTGWLAVAHVTPPTSWG